MDMDQLLRRYTFNDKSTLKTTSQSSLLPNPGSESITTIPVAFEIVLLQSPLSMVVKKVSC